MDLASLIEALADPAAYPYPVGEVEVRQTHISAVFLAGPYAYKVKKPVNPGFLDFSTLDRRLHFCEEEVRLNRRLAPEVYLGVVPVVRTAQGLRFEGEGEVVEWAVKMRRLPDAATLLERLKRGEVDVALVQALARRIAAFHRKAEANDRTADFGRFEAAARLVRDLFAQASSHAARTVSRNIFDRLQSLAEKELERLRPIIDGRAARGMTRDCHGDMHLDHVYLFPGRPPPADLVFIDCIEFNERFRFIDPVADMAFPLMDLVFHGRRDLARAFAEAYFHASGDEEGRALLPLYTAYRAMVRGTVEGLLVAEKEAPEAERSAALGRAQAHWLLALTELESPERKPCLVLATGLPGVGKSSLARGLADRAGFHVIRSDAVRKELAGISSQGRTPPQPFESLYTEAWNERTYAECLHRAERLLREGKRVFVDATFREEAKRQVFLDAAVRCGAPGALLLCQADAATVRQRLARRQGDASDADWSIYLQAARSWEEVGPRTRQLTHVVSTEGSLEQSVIQALDVLRQLGLYV